MTNLSALAEETPTATWIDGDRFSFFNALAICGAHAIARTIIVLRLLPALRCDRLSNWLFRLGWAATRRVRNDRWRRRRAPGIVLHALQIAPAVAPITAALSAMAPIAEVDGLLDLLRGSGSAHAARRDIVDMKRQKEHRHGNRH